MSKSYKSHQVSLSNKFHIIAEPIHASEIDDLDDDYTDYRWLAKSRRMQARRWRKIKHQLA